MTEGQDPNFSDAHTLLDPGQLAVIRQPGVPKTRKCLRISRVSPDIQIVPFNNNIDTLQRAVAERVFLVKNGETFTPPPKPLPGVFADTVKSAYELLKPHLPSTAPLNFQQTVDTFRGCKRKRYERALKNIRESYSSIDKESEVNVFVKYEKTDRTSKVDPVPRVISPRKPEYNLRVAKYLRKIEEPLLKALGKMFGHKTVMKGVDVQQTAQLLREKWDMFHSPVAVGLDASRFDQHVSKSALQFEHSVYLDCFRSKKHKSKLNGILQYQLHNKCSGFVEDGKLKYEVVGTRMSGDMNTSLGNCVLMCVMVKAYALHCGINLQLANNGDDCVVFMEKRDLHLFQRDLNNWFLKLGFNMVVEKPSFEFEAIEFCQTRPVFDGNLWVMCRNPVTALVKDAVLLKDPKVVSEDFMMEWIEAVGNGGLALAGRLPIFQSFYNMYLRSASTYRRNRMKKWRVRSHDEILPWFMRETGLKGNRQCGDVTPDCRSSFYFAYGITPDEQLETEKFYDSMFVDSKISEGWYPRNIFVG